MLADVEGAPEGKVDRAGALKTPNDCRARLTAAWTRTGKKIAGTPVEVK